MIKLYSSQNLVLIYLIKEELENQKILTMLKNAEPPLGGEIPRAIAWPELWIMHDEDYPTAKTTVENLLLKHADGKNWRCAHCEETNESQFTICWKCEMSRF